MKLTVIITCLLMVSISSFGEVAKPKHPAVHVLSRRMDCFYFKVSRQVIGAEIEVYTEQGEKVMSQTLKHKHALVDFYNEAPGHFIIKITKGDVRESYDYHKKTPSPFIPIEITRVTLAD